MELKYLPVPSLRSFEMMEHDAGIASLIGGVSCHWLAFDDPLYTVAQANMRITVCMKSASEASFGAEWVFFSHRGSKSSLVRDDRFSLQGTSWALLINSVRTSMAMIEPFCSWNQSSTLSNGPRAIHCQMTRERSSPEGTNKIVLALMYRFSVS